MDTVDSTKYNICDGWFIGKVWQDYRDSYVVRLKLQNVLEHVLEHVLELAK